MPISVSAVTSGTCGDNLTWTLDDGVLTISGTGAMWNWYGTANSPGWQEYYEEIESVVIKNGVTSIGNGAFFGHVWDGSTSYPNLKSVSMSDSIERIGYYAFWRCENLEYISFSDNISYVGNDAFTYTVWYNNLPNGCVYIGKVLYEYKGDMNEETSIKVKEGTTRINENAFYGKDKLSNIELPDSISIIDNNAFYGCINLTYIFLPENLKSIGSCAFENSGIKQILIPKTVETLNTWMGVKTILGYAESTAETFCKTINAGYYYREVIADGKCGETVYWYLVDDTLYIIGRGAMNDYQNINSVPWYKYNNTIKNVMFKNNLITHVSENCFDNKITMKAAPNTAVETYAKDHSINFVDCIDEGCCGALYKDNGYWYHDNVCWELSSTGTLNIFGTGKTADFSIGKSSVYPHWKEYCDIIKKIYIQDGIEEIGSQITAFCDSVNVYIPKSVTDVTSGQYGNAFLGNVSAFYVDSKNENLCSVDGVLFNKDKTTLLNYPSKNGAATYSLPDSVITINDWAFRENANLKIIDFNNKLQSIGYRSFWECSNLAFIHIPQSVNSIDTAAFAECTNIKYAYLPTTITALYNDTFSYCSQLSDIYYSGTEDEYNETTISNAVNSDVTIHYNSRIVTYDYATNGGNSSTVEYNIVTSGENADLSPTATKTGYNFVGWNTDPNAKTALSSYTVTDDVTLYAIYAVPVTGVTLDKSDVSLEDGKKEILVATVAPANATDKTVSWKSSDKEVATVLNGKITAKSAGTATITVTTADGGYTAECEVTVTEKFVDENAPTITIGEVKAKPGNTVDVTVVLKNNTGFMNLGVEVGYNADVMTLTKVTADSGVGLNYVPGQSLTQNPYNFGWSGVSDTSYNGTLATLTFTVKDDADDGVYPITLDYFKGRNGDYVDGDNVNFDEDYNAVGFVYVGGSVTVASYVPGDINGDGVVDNKDGTHLLRYLAGWDLTNVNNDALDVDGSSKVDDKDGTHLLRYLAGWNVTLH